MMITIQFPIADLRSFLQSGQKRPTDNLLDLDSSRQWLPYFGRARRRLRGGVGPTSTEDRYVDASNAIRFPDSLDRPSVERAYGVAGFQVAFRRLLDAGTPVARLQLGLVPSSSDAATMPLQTILDLAVSIPVRIRVGDDWLEQPLAVAGRDIAEAVRAATARSESEPTPSWAMASGQLLVIAQESQRDDPPFAQQVGLLTNEKHRVTHWLARPNDVETAFWSIRVRAASSEDTRRLRVHLGVIQSQRVVLRHVLQQIAVGRLRLSKDEVDPIWRYLERQQLAFQHRTASGMPNAKLIDRLYGSSEIVSAIDRARILEQIADVQPRSETFNTLNSLRRDPWNIHFLAASPQGRPYLRVGAEHDAMAKGLDDNERFKVMPTMGANPKTVTDRLLKHKATILHISAHGERDGTIIFEGDEGGAERVSGDDFFNLVTSTVDSLVCVVMMSCYSRQHCQRLAQAVPLAIGVEGEIADDAAVVFVRAFYLSLGQGSGLSSAFQVAKNTVHIHPDLSGESKRIFGWRRSGKRSDLVDLLTW